MFYRNTVDVVSIEGHSIDTGSLWEFNKHENKYVLVDEDLYATIKPNPNCFARVTSNLERL